jgi:ParE toxin of type II toxin-antitoxin system, parDE
MKYAVEITDAAFEAIQAQAKYTAIECKAPLNASRWLEQVWDVIDGLEQMPQRHNLAAEDAFKSYEVRRALAGNFLILFTIEQKARKVWVIGFRYGGRLPRPDDLPNQPPQASRG